MLAAKTASLFSWLWVISLSSGVRLLTSGQPLASYPMCQNLRKKYSDGMPGLTGFYRDLCEFCQQLFELSLCDLSTELATISTIAWYAEHTEPESWSDNPNCWWYRVDCVSHQTQKSITERASTASKSQSPKWPKTQVPHRQNIVEHSEK